MFVLLAALQVQARKKPLHNYFGIAPELRSAQKKPAVVKDEGDGYYPHSVVKLNLTQLAILNLSLQYEFAFHKNISVAIGVSRFLPHPFPGLFTKDDPSGEGLRDAKFSGTSITPEFRFYPGRKQKHKAPHGFYLALYLRYATYTLSSQYYNIYNNQNYGYDVSATYKGVNGGLMLGYQWIIAKHVSLDFWILGGGFGQAKFNLTANSQGVSLSPDQQNQVKQAVYDEMLQAKFLNASDPVITTTDHSVQASMSGLPMASLRGLGLCLGIAF